mmetsp:Transcript_47314/g.56902  ORF Transcript_47314/g.56902 Transcript_47314/m.56902 type:complete len:636 (-) Transcript_47314:689-2596(-)
MEYEIYDLNITKAGNGYVFTQPPTINVYPPDEELDWTLGEERLIDPASKARVTEMRKDGSSPVDNSILSEIMKDPAASPVYNSILSEITKDPVALLPSSALPELVEISKVEAGTGSSSSYKIYRIDSLPPVPTKTLLPSARYASLDPIFGGIGTSPVTKGALSLSADQYSRLSFAGGICTVLVRTVLNPLEIVKTKVQLGNDVELNEYASNLVNKKTHKSENGAADSDMISDKIAKSDSLDTSVEKPITVDNSFSTTEFVGDSDTEIANMFFCDEASIEIEPQMKSDIVMESSDSTTSQQAVGTLDILRSMIELRGPLALFQSADITFLASIVFGGLGFGATELFRRVFTSSFSDGSATKDLKSQVIILVAASFATLLTSFVAAPFETLRVRSMGMVEGKGWISVLQDLLEDNRKERSDLLPAETTSTNNLSPENSTNHQFRFSDLTKEDLPPLWKAFPPIASRELPFAVTKFLAFDLVADLIINLLSTQEAIEPVQIGVGPNGLAVSAVAGAVAGVIGAVVSHPADLILTLTASASTKVESEVQSDGQSGEADEHKETNKPSDPDWKDIVADLLSKDGGALNLFVGLPARSSFFFLVIGLQFFLYDFVKNLFGVGSNDLTLVLDVFNAVRSNLI